MKYLFYLYLCFLIPLNSSAQSSVSTDSLFARSFAMCYHDDSIRLQSDELIYFKAVRHNGRFVLSVLKGTHSKDVYIKLINTLDCIEMEYVPNKGIEFILLNRKLDLKNKENDREKLENFRRTYSISSGVEVIKTGFGKDFR